MNAVGVHGKGHIRVVVDHERNASGPSHFEKRPGAFGHGALFPLGCAQLNERDASEEGFLSGADHPFGAPAEIGVEHEIKTQRRGIKNRHRQAPALSSSGRIV